MKKSTTRIAALVLAVCALALGASVAQAAVNRTDVTSTGVRVRPGVQVDIVSSVFTKPNRNSGKTVLCLEGLAHTGTPSFEALAEKILQDSSVQRVVVLNLPGRGNMSFPYGSAGVKFGELNVEDYAVILRHMLRRYPDVSEIDAHSMGALVVFVAQDQLKARGTSLRQRFGVTKVQGMGSSSPMQVPDPFLEAGNGLGLLSFFTFSDPVLGDFVATDAASFRDLLFFVRKSDGIVPSGAPSAAEIDSSGIMSIESYAAALQTVGTADMRPSVRAGLFASSCGTSLKLLVGSEDPFSDPAQQTALSQHLTGSPNHVVLLPGQKSVHDQFVFNPGPVATALGH